jgi:hypothetical protein
MGNYYLPFNRYMPFGLFLHNLKIFETESFYYINGEYKSGKDKEILCNYSVEEKINYIGNKNLIYFYYQQNDKNKLYSLVLEWNKPEWVYNYAAHILRKHDLLLYNKIIELKDAYYACFYAFYVLCRHDNRIYDIVLESKDDFLISGYLLKFGPIGD